MAQVAFIREELQDIKERARQMALVGAADELWKLAHWELAAAADRLDAMLARSEASANPAATQTGPRPWPTGPVPAQQ